MKQSYPRMLYPAGDAAADPVIVNDEAEEAARRKDGYQRLGDQPKAKESKPAAPPTPPADSPKSGETAKGDTPLDAPADAATAPVTASKPEAPKRGRPPKAAKTKAK
ncbi:hypothetical protein [Lysobacter enzymogenes]|uniref:hypothetical protein n=1 Tax=Lysobacter enzymogenes TaxID=69 RepID=UPI00089D20C8|nr:hypothetical protein [Lysobacter enzymogenes]SDX52822.1 hypothetical protein SAMN05421681_10628 [Lysobacter enzymogenes]